MMDMMPSLGAIICYGTGYDGVDLRAAAERKMRVGHSPGANASSVADIAVSRDAGGDPAIAGGRQLCAKRGGDEADRRQCARNRACAVAGLASMGMVNPAARLPRAPAAFEAEVG